MSRAQYCLSVFRADLATLSLPEAERRQAVAALTDSAETFATDALAHQAAISVADELMVVAFLSMLVGGPLLLMLAGAYLAFCGSWAALSSWLLGSAALAMHPMPRVDLCKASLFDTWFASSRLTCALYKYFSFRIVWSGDDKELAVLAPAWLGAGPPHGVLPFANILSMPAINTFIGRRFVGTPASVVFHTPFLRYLTLFGAVDVGAPSIRRALAHGCCVGLVPDGVAGLFHTNSDDEVVALKTRKGPGTGS